MALVSRMVSDLTGAEAAESEFIKLVVREHPGIDQPKSLDVLPKEVEGLKTAGEIVVLEVNHNGFKKQLVMTLADFRKVCPDDKVTSAPGTRGRRPGFSPAAPKPEPAQPTLVEVPKPAKKAAAKKTA